MSELTPRRRELLDALHDSFHVFWAAVGRRRGRDTHHGGALGMAHLRLVAALHGIGAPGSGEPTDAVEGHAVVPASGARLAHAAHLSPAAVSGMLDHLEQAGIITRERSPHDRRVQMIALTEEGRRAYERKQQALFERGVAALADCSDRELAAAAKVVTRLAQTIEAED
ncbi:MAG: MarR family winged helix-turn-helix transcriptional regulator [Gaiellaceae bacterium]